MGSVACTAADRRRLWQRHRYVELGPCFGRNRAADCGNAQHIYGASHTDIAHLAWRSGGHVDDDANWYWCDYADDDANRYRCDHTNRPRFLAVRPGTAVNSIDAFIRTRSPPRHLDR
jgi:hypothetical protein